MHFIKYYDATQNATFLRETAYPYLRLVADFYESYMTENPTTKKCDVHFRTEMCTECVLCP